MKKIIICIIFIIKTILNYTIFTNNQLSNLDNINISYYYTDYKSSLFLLDGINSKYYEINTKTGATITSHTINNINTSSRIDQIDSSHFLLTFHNNHLFTVIDSTSYSEISTLDVSSLTEIENFIKNNYNSEFSISLNSFYSTPGIFFKNNMLYASSTIKIEENSSNIHLGYIHLIFLIDQTTYTISPGPFLFESNYTISKSGNTIKPFFKIITTNTKENDIIFYTVPQTQTSVTAYQRYDFDSTSIRNFSDFNIKDNFIYNKTYFVVYGNKPANNNYAFIMYFHPVIYDSISLPIQVNNLDLISHAILNDKYYIISILSSNNIFYCYIFYQYNAVGQFHFNNNNVYNFMIQMSINQLESSYIFYKNNLYYFMIIQYQECKDLNVTYNLGQTYSIYADDLLKSFSVSNDNTSIIFLTNNQNLEVLFDSTKRGIQKISYTQTTGASFSTTFKLLSVSYESVITYDSDEKEINECNFKIIYCNEACSSCSEYSSDSSNTKCIECANNYYKKRDGDSSQCYLSSTIFEGYYANSTTGYFEKCDESCKTCTGPGKCSNDNSNSNNNSKSNNNSNGKNENSNNNNNNDSSNDSSSEKEDDNKISLNLEQEIDDLKKEIEKKILSLSSLYENEIYHITIFSKSFDDNNNDKTTNNNNNESSIDVSECESTLKKHYNISSIIIVKIDIKTNSSTNNLNYLIFNNKGELLDTSFCEFISIQIPIKTEISELNFTEIYLFLQNSIDLTDETDKFFNDFCSPYDLDNSKGLPFNKRKENLLIEESLCPDFNCSLYNITDNYTKIECRCEGEYVREENYKNNKKNNNLSVIRCMKLGFKWKRFKDNYAGWIFLFIFVGQFSSGIYLFVVNGKEIFAVPPKKKNNKKKDEDDDEDDDDDEEDSDKNKYNNNIKDDTESKHNLHSSKTSNISESNKSNNLLINNNNKTKENTVTIYKNEDKNMNNNVNNNNNNNKNEKKNKNNENNKNKSKFSDYELEYSNFNESIKNDSRTFSQTYKYYIINHQTLLNLFVNNNEKNNIIPIKISMFLLSITLIFGFNMLYLTNKLKNEIYEKGNISFNKRIIQNILSLLSYLIIYMLLSLLISYNHLIDNLNENKINKNEYKSKLKIKFIIFFIIDLIISLLFWFYILCFFAVYPKYKTEWLISCLLSYLIVLILPFIFCLIYVIFRKIGLSFNLCVFFYIGQIIDFISNTKYKKIFNC